MIEEVCGYIAVSAIGFLTGIGIGWIVESIKEYFNKKGENNEQ